MFAKNRLSKWPRSHLFQNIFCKMMKVSHQIITETERKVNKFSKFCYILATYLKPIIVYIWRFQNFFPLNLATFAFSLSQESLMEHCQTFIWIFCWSSTGFFWSPRGQNLRKRNEVGHR
jgi:hypothetical protein